MTTFMQRSFGAPAALIVMLAAGLAGAADYIWTGGGDGTTWASAPNWGVAGYPAGAGDTATIDAGAAAIGVASDLTLGALTLGGDYTGTLTLGGTLTVTDAGGASGGLTVNAGTMQTAQNTTSDIIISNTFTIGSGGTVIVRYSSLSANGGHGAGQTIRAKNLTVDGALNADRTGFINTGPGRVAANHGASHGGGAGLRGPTSTMTYETAFTPAIGPTYGSVKNPIALGSGGKTAGGNGGGAIRIIVEQHVALDGAISANATGVDRGGSGGSIWIEAATMAGTGKVQAIGANSNHPQLGASAGGRIAVLLSEGTGFDDVDFEAFGGTLNWHALAAAGTVYRERKDGAAVFSELVVDNNGNTTFHHTEMDNGGLNLNLLDRITIRNAGNLAIRENDILDFSQAVIEGDGTGFLTIAATNHVTFPAPFSLSTNYTLCLDVPIAVAGDWTIPADAVLSHNQNVVTDARKLDLTIGGWLTIDDGGAIDATAKGFPTRIGPGSTTSGSNGAAHGGRGHDATSGYTPAIGETYGSALRTVTLGSGGGDGSAFGGGAIRLTLSGAVTHNGEISANGGNAAGNTGGASGGSVLIEAAELSGDGKVFARGGNGNHDSMGSGGGGRIAVRIDTGTDFGSVEFDAGGGTTVRRGAAGTIYKQHADHPEGGGVLLIKNPHTTQGTDIVTPLPAEIDVATLASELPDVKLVVDHIGEAALITNLTIRTFDISAGIADPRLYLNGYTLTVRSLKPRGWVDPAPGINYGTENEEGEIVWSRPGTAMILR